MEIQCYTGSYAQIANYQVGTKRGDRSAEAELLDGA